MIPPALASHSSRERAGGIVDDGSAVTQGYSLRDVGKLLGLSRSIITGLVGAGFVTPSRGRRGEYRFSFQDLVLLRAAQALSRANVAPSRILRALKRLRAQLPADVPLTGLRIEAVGDAVVVNEGSAQWRADDGQYVMRFAVEVRGGDNGRIATLPHGSRGNGDEAAGLAFVDAPSRDSAGSWFERGLALENDDIERACDAYRNALAQDDRHLDAYVNLGRCLHAVERFGEAEAVYRKAIMRCGEHELVLFNLGVLLEDMERPSEAAEAYRRALRLAPGMADAHYNLALICEAQGLQQETVRHLSAYRKLKG